MPRLNPTPPINPLIPSPESYLKPAPLSPVATEKTSLPTLNGSSPILPADKFSAPPQGSANPSLSLDADPAPAASTPQFIEHTVKRGDNLADIAKKYLGDPKRYLEIYKANQDDLRNPNDLRIGMTLKIPVPAGTQVPAGPQPPVQEKPGTDKPAPVENPVPPADSPAPPAETNYTPYKVERGETLGEIALDELGDAERYMEIFEANKDQLKTPNSLRPGMILRIPARTPAVQAPDQKPEPTPTTDPAAVVDASGLTPGANDLLAAMQRYQKHYADLGVTGRSRTTPAEMRQIAIELDGAARAFDVDPKMMLAVFAHESGGLNPKARSHTGAGGLGQLTSIAIRQVHYMAGIGKGSDAREPYSQYKDNFIQTTRSIQKRYDIPGNVWTSTAYMSYELNDRARLGRGIEKALKRYGDPTVKNYADKVNEEYNTLFGGKLF